MHLLHFLCVSTAIINRPVSLHSSVCSLDKKYMNITLSLHKSNGSNKQSNESIQEWWTVNQTEAGPLSVRDASESGLELYIFSDEVSPPSLGFLAGYG